MGLAATARADLGVPISAPKHVNANAIGDAGSDVSPALASDGKGNWIAVWDSNDPLGNTIGTDGDILFARSIDNGQNWSSPAPANTNAGADTARDSDADIATDGKGNWVVIWTSNNSLGNTIGTDRDILYARSIDTGANWSSPLPLNSTAATDTAGDSDPDVATDGKGHWLAVWDSTNTLGNTIGSDDDILFSRSNDNGATWSPAAPLNSNAATDAAGDEYPRIACDSSGHCVAAWHSDGPAGSPNGTDDDMLVARSLDNGANWSSPTTLNSNAKTDSADDKYVRVATDGVGNWVAVWESPITSGGDSEILAARSIDGGANWSSVAPVNTNAGTDNGSDTLAAIAADGRGNVLVVWESTNTLIDVAVTDQDIHAARFAVPDCNNNLIADSTEVVLGLLPDINFNNIPDVCEFFDEPAPSRPNGCGVGLCGAGAMMFGPLTLAGMACIGRAMRRRR